MWNKRNSVRAFAHEDESGFTLIEGVVAMVILSVGLLSTAAAITFALEFTSLSRNVTSGKMVIVSSIEEIESLRNTRRLEFKQINNVARVDNTNVENPFTGFLDGWQKISSSAGPDGVNGTADDFISSGADGTYGTADDATDYSLAKRGYERKIEIGMLTGSTTIKKVKVSVRYPAAQGKTGEISGVGYLNDEFRITK